MRASVVVPTCRRRLLLDRCLSALLTQTLPPSEYEVIVCDDAGEMDLAWFVREAARRFGRFDVRCLAPGAARGPAAARNRGWRAACADVVAFTDDDCIPAPDWLEAGLEGLQDLDAAQGRIIVPLRETPTDYELNTSGLEQAACATANFFCRRRALESVRGFDERFRRAWREDSDLHFTLVEAGFNVGRVPRSVVVHPVRPASWGVGLTIQSNSFYDALLYKKHPALYRDVVGGPPWRYYAAVFCLAVGALGWSAGASSLRRIAAVWAAWTLWFCARRLRRTSKRPAHVLEMAVTSVLLPPMAIYWRLRGAMTFKVRFL